MPSPDQQRLAAIVAGAVSEALHGSPEPPGPAGAAVPADVASLIDHTLLRPDATRADIERLCREGRERRFAAVCVNPGWVGMAANLLGGSRIKVCSVVGFPLGATTAEAKQHEARLAISDGASELDMVINLGALKSGDLCLVEADVAGVSDACRDAGALSKVIIETGFLTDEEKVAACVLAKLAGADYVKTCTGFGPGGATAGDVALMRRVVGRSMGVKAAGGVRDYETLRLLVRSGANRIGTSAGVRIVEESRARATGG